MHMAMSLHLAHSARTNLFDILVGPWYGVNAGSGLGVALTIRKFLQRNFLMAYAVQIGRGRGAYKTRWVFNNAAQAELYYRCLNIGRGYKKRLLEGNRVVVRAFS